MQKTDYAIINPASGELIEAIPFDSDARIQNIIESHAESFSQWNQSDFNHRADCFNSIASILRNNKDDLAYTVALEMGKPVSQAFAEVDKCAFVCEHYASHAESFLSPYDVQTELSLSRVVYRPLGTIFAIMPWNFPLWQVFRAAAPIIMAGNTLILKHAPRVPRTAKRIEEIFLEAGFPKRVFSNVFASNEQASKIISSTLIKGVCLTGSCGAGRAVASEAGRNLKPVLLELGGSDPYIVLDDADMKLAAEKIAFSRMLNNGQTCISAKRFIVMESVMDEFTECLIKELERYKVGDPREPETSQGPLAREDLLTELEDQVKRSLAEGAEIVYQGKKAELEGYFYPISILKNVLPGMAAFDEELFGPVGAIISASSIEQAVSLANQSSFGLGAAVFTQDVQAGIDLASNYINAGTCVVNDFVRSDPRLPFGGINDSGFGRELGVEGIKFFVNVKTVCSA